MTRRPTAKAVVGWEDTSLEFEPQGSSSGAGAGCRSLKDVAEGVIALAGTGILYVAQELVFALSGEVHAADTDDYGMENDLRYEEAGMEKRRSRSKSRNRKQKKNKKKSSKPDADVKLYSAYEGRDEESERAYTVVDLITKYNGSTGSSTSSVERGASYPKAPPAPPSATSKWQEIFRPRSTDEKAPDDSERFAYLGSKQQTQIQPISESSAPVTFSPLASFRELHQANRKALFDDDTVYNGSKITATQSPSHTPAVTTAPEASTAPERRVIVVDAETVKTTKSAGTEIVDIRSEIQDIQRIIARFEEERAARPKPGVSTGLKPEDAGNPTHSTEVATPKKKDPKRNAEIRELISRLERLSIRHEELRARQIANTAATRRDPAPTVTTSNSAAPVGVTSQ